MRLKRANALTVKPGPTQSGGSSPSPEPVGGEVLPVFGGEIMSLAIVALVLVFGFVLVRKTGLLSSLLTRLGL
ncbi:MAG: hypothetical protein ACFFCW_33280 [Candidatus Hodarchaeota archaeon]